VREIELHVAGERADLEPLRHDDLAAAHDAAERRADGHGRPAHGGQAAWGLEVGGECRERGGRGSGVHRRRAALELVHRELVAGEPLRQLLDDVLARRR
jgi:hypothetical protein